MRLVFGLEYHLLLLIDYDYGVIYIVSTSLSTCKVWSQSSLSKPKPKT